MDLIGNTFQRLPSTKKAIFNAKIFNPIPPMYGVKNIELQMLNNELFNFFLKDKEDAFKKG